MQQPKTYTEKATDGAHLQLIFCTLVMEAACHTKAKHFAKHEQRHRRLMHWVMVELLFYFVSRFTRH